MSHKIFDNNLVAICKSKVTLMPNKPAYVGIVFCNSVLKVLKYEFHYDYIKKNMAINQDYYSKTLII